MPGNRPVTAIVFEGGQPLHPLAVPMMAVRTSVTLDTLQKLLHVPEIEQVVVCSDRADVVEGARRLGAIVEEQPPGPFHFGRWLQDVVQRRAREGVLYLGGASAPLMTRADFAAAASLLTWGGPRVVANNPQSPDLVGFYPAGLIQSVQAPPTDNALGLALRDLDVERILVPVSYRASFDLDTPTDLLIYREILRATPGGAQPQRRVGAAGGLSAAVAPRGNQLRADASAATRALLESLDWNPPRWDEALRQLSRPFADVALIGRVGAPLIAHLNETYSLRLRVFSEERGMKALGREERGEVRTLLGAYIEDVGPRRFFERLAEVADVAVIDTRPLVSHGGRKVSEADRFASDLGMVESIKDPGVRDLASAAADLRALPTILGGHSLVSGGLSALLLARVRQRQQSKAEV
ncbi:MAG: hypothetical protein ACM3ZA_02250 [Bacillota bacterium]